MREERAREGESVAGRCARGHERESEGGASAVREGTSERVREVWALRARARARECSAGREAEQHESTAARARGCVRACGVPSKERRGVRCKKSKRGFMKFWGFI